MSCGFKVKQLERTPIPNAHRAELQAKKLFLGLRALNVAQRDVNDADRVLHLIKDAFLPESFPD